MTLGLLVVTGKHHYVLVLGCWGTGETRKEKDTRADLRRPVCTGLILQKADIKSKKMVQKFSWERVCAMNHIKITLHRCSQFIAQKKCK